MRRFQTSLDISLPVKLIGKWHRPQIKTFIRGASPGVSDELWDKNAIGGRRLNVASQERKFCNMEIEIVTFIVKGNVKLTVPTDWQEKIQVGSRCVALRRVSDLKLSGIHLTEIILEVCVLLMGKTSSMYLYVKLNWDANRFLPAESKDCMNSASYEYRNMSARRGAQFVPMGIPIICWKPFPAKTTKMLSTRNSSILKMSSSVCKLGRIKGIRNFILSRSKIVKRIRCRQ